jgi:hypothetical protein
MPELERAFVKAFVLEPSKLQRVVDIVRASFGDTPYTIEFRVALKDNKRLLLTDIEQVLAHDNSLTNPIQDLRLEAVVEDEDKFKHCVIQFLRVKETYLPPISIKLVADEVRWVSTLGAELEEQVERMLQHGPIYALLQSQAFRKLFSMVLIPALVAAAFLFLFVDPSEPARAVQDQREMLEQARQAAAIDQKIDALIDFHLNTLRNSTDTVVSRLRLPKWDVKMLFEAAPLLIAAAPLLIAALLSAYLVMRCYPTAIFAWGDTGDHYASMLVRRRTIWNIIFVAIGLSILVRLSATVLFRELGL